MSTKFFVFGGGRWREVCLDTGTVSGWGNSARFVHCSGKRLHVARRRSVLAGLRALAAGIPTSVRNGPRLTQRRQVNHQGTRRVVPLASCRRYCQHKPNTSTNIRELPATSASAVKQTQTDDTLQVAELPEKICTNTQAAGELTLHKSPLKKLSRKTGIKKKVKKPMQSVIAFRHSSGSCEDSVESSQSVILVPSHHVRASKRTNHVTDNSVNQKSVKQKECRVNSTSADEALAVVAKTKRRDKAARAHNNNRLQKRLDKRQGHRPSGTVAEFISKIIGPNAANNSQKTNYTSCTIRQKAVALESESTSGSESPLLSRISPALKRGNTCKELIIDEADVIALRTFLERNTSEDVLLQFDSDDTYKQAVFYSINPLVRLERCPRISQMVSNARLIDFVSQLGLRSVSESSVREPVRYKTRRSLAMAAVRTSNQDDTDKENLNNLRIKRHREESGLASRLRKSNRVLGEKSPEKVTDLQKLPKPPVVNIVSSSSDSEDAFVKESLPQKPVKKVAKKPVLLPTLKVSRRGYRSGVQEYSTLEDQAIVRWVSEGSRATKVNGNALWQELHEQYYTLTGQRRTWQSLRNRYLRYVLPALGRLSLPPRRATELRAAAATGEMKKKRKPPRRNSIFNLTKVEAASTRAPERKLRTPVTQEDSDSNDSPPAKRLRNSASRWSGRAEPDPEAQPPTRSRTRKLFNPNAIL